MDQLPLKLGGDKRVTPLVAAGPNACPLQRRDRRLETGVVAAVGTVVIPAVGELQLCAGQALPSLVEKRVVALEHGGSVAERTAAARSRGSVLRQPASRKP